jgi:hypothetical protein
MDYYAPDLQIEFCRSFRWIRFTSFCTVLRDLSIVNFDDKHALKAARTELIQALSSSIPFSFGTRFPENVKYVCVDKPQLFGQLVQVLRMLATPDSMLTGAAIKDYFSAIARMREMIHESEERVVFSRETFEREFDLIWLKEPSNDDALPPPLIHVVTPVVASSSQTAQIIEALAALQEGMSSMQLTISSIQQEICSVNLRVKQCQLDIQECLQHHHPSDSYDEHENCGYC